jgi:hypothetical protein
MNMIGIFICTFDDGAVRENGRRRSVWDNPTSYFVLGQRLLSLFWPFLVCIAKSLSKGSFAC